MDEMIGYIFGSLHDTENAIKVFGKALKSQTKFNDGVVGFMTATIIYLYLNEHRQKKQDKQIKALTREIEELKIMKGE